MLGQRPCDHESEVLHAIAVDERTPEVQSHLETCAACRETAAVATWMRTMADTSAEAHALPDPRVLWLKAQLVHRWNATRRAEVPVDAMERIQVLVLLIGVAGILVWQVPRLWGWLTGGGGFSAVSAATDVAALAFSPQVLSILPLVALGLALATMVVLHRLLVEQ